MGDETAKRRHATVARVNTVKYGDFYFHAVLMCVKTDKMDFYYRLQFSQVFIHSACFFYTPNNNENITVKLTNYCIELLTKINV